MTSHCHTSVLGDMVVDWIVLQSRVLHGLGKLHPQVVDDDMFFQQESSGCNWIESKRFESVSSLQLVQVLGCGTKLEYVDTLDD